METKTIQLEIPEYLTIGQYQSIASIDTEKPWERYIRIICGITGLDYDEVKYWDMPSIQKVFKTIEKSYDPKNEFHSIVEYNGVLYGYDNIKQQSLGEYIDLENLSGDFLNNLHKIAAILYRPINKNRFKSLSFKFKQGFKIADNKVENVFDYYTIEKYDSEKRKDREQEFLDFPVHIALGATSFFLNNGSQYSNNIAYLKGLMSWKEMSKSNRQILDSLLDSTGAGGGLFTHSLKPIYYRFQGNQLLQISTL